MTTRVLIHDDDCGAVLSDDGMCPVCKFYPDMQSTAFVVEDVKQDEGE